MRVYYLEEGLHCLGEATSHDHLVGVDVIQGLGGDVGGTGVCVCVCVWGGGGRGGGE